ncbi:MAG: YdeI/OmpD-associated family protein [Sciscionella sp.]
MSFRTTLEVGGKTATGIAVPEDVVAALASGKRPAVVVTLNGYTYRSTVAVLGGRFMLPVSAEVRSRSGVAAGDEVEVDLWLDTEPREVCVPADFAAALADDPEAQRVFDGLSYSRKRGYVQLITGAKAEQTRLRRIAKAIAELHEGNPRP